MQTTTELKSFRNDTKTKYSTSFHFRTISSDKANYFFEIKLIISYEPYKSLRSAFVTCVNFWHAIDSKSESMCSERRIMP